MICNHSLYFSCDHDEKAAEKDKTKKAQWRDEQFINTCIIVDAHLDRVYMGDYLKGIKVSLPTLPIQDEQ